MQISLKLNTGIDNVTESRDGLCRRLRKTIFHASVRNFTMVLCVLCLLTILYISRSYTSEVLIWLEKQDVVIIHLVIVVLFVVVSFPIAVGYIIIVVATGYLFGMVIGLRLTIIGANLGLAIAHYVLRFVRYYSSVRTLFSNETVVAITKVISGPSCFKIVFCARLTPIPFGLQNTIFALTNVNGKIYHIASLLGLLPGQVMATYVGASLRSMQDVFNDQHISGRTYFFAFTQLILAIVLLLWVGSMARKEISKAIAEADGKSYLAEKTGYNIV